MALPFASLFSKAEQPGWLDPAELAPLLDAPSPPLLIDVRSPAEFTGPLGHIDGAVNIPLDEFAARAAEVTGADRPVILICHTDRRSAAACQHLRSLGLEQAGVLRGGMTAWTRAGLPTA